MKHKPSIPNNIKHWKVFKDDQEIKKFIEIVDEFLASFINQDEDTDEKDARSVSKHDC